MNREKAIEIFKRLKENAPNEMHLETVGTAQELFDMAIQALSQEPIKYWIDHNGHVIPIQQPSVTQKCEKCAMNGSGSKYCDNCGPKSGKWILLDECANSGYYCSNCQKKLVKEGWSNTVKKIKFCPNCGARMVEPQESEE